MIKAHWPALGSLRVSKNRITSEKIPTLGKLALTKLTYIDVSMLSKIRLQPDQLREQEKVGAVGEWQPELVLEWGPGGRPTARESIFAGHL